MLSLSWYTSIKHYVKRIVQTSIDSSKYIKSLEERLRVARKNNICAALARKNDIQPGQGTHHMSKRPAESPLIANTQKQWNSNLRDTEDDNEQEEDSESILSSPDEVTPDYKWLKVHLQQMNDANIRKY